MFATIIYPDGRTKLVFLSAAEGFRVEGSGAVDADGLMFTTVSSGSESTGKLDSENCTAEGVWANLDLGVSGTWEMRRVSDSLTGDVARSLGCEPGSIPSHREAALIRPDFSDQDLRCGDFTLAELTEADFTNSLLDGAVFRDANLEQPLFSGSSLVSADLRDVVLTRASFIDADLRNADLRAIVVGGITFANTVCPDGLNSDETAGGACVVAPPD